MQEMIDKGTLYDITSNAKKLSASEVKRFLKSQEEYKRCRQCEDKVYFSEDDVVGAISDGAVLAKVTVSKQLHNK